MTYDRWRTRSDLDDHPTYEPDEPDIDVPVSWAPQVRADDTGKWYGNHLRFPTRDEAEANVRNLWMRWTAVREFRVIEVNEPANYQWIDGHLVPIKPGDPL